MKQYDSKQKAAKIIRVCTIAPVFALLLLAVLYLRVPGFYFSTAHFILAVCCLCVLPVLAYPLSHIFHLPPDKFRERQRKMAIIFSLAGYIILIVTAFVCGYTHGEMAVYLTYTISVAVIAITSIWPKYKASGHACGVAGPICMLVHFVSPWFLLLTAALGGVFWSSLVLKRHNLPQLITGTLTPVLIIFVLSAINYI